MLALGTSYLLASSAVWLRRIPGNPRWAGFVLLTGLLFACPLFVPDQWHNLPRGVVATVTVYFWLKALDGISRFPEGGDTRVGGHLWQMLNLGSLVAAPWHEGVPATPTHERLREVLVWLAAFAAAGGLLLAAFRVDWRGASFLVEHAAKSVGIACLILSSMNLHGALWRLAGVRSLHSPATALIACSPAEFWRRWNRPLGEWLHCHVFRRVARPGTRTGAILITFGVSGLLHEYVIGMITERFSGFPTAFFLVQGVAVAATFGVTIKPRWSLAARALTIAFNVCSSTLLFLPFNRVMPFYQNVVPPWLYLQ